MHHSLLLTSHFWIFLFISHSSILDSHWFSLLTLNFSHFNSCYTLHFSSLTSHHLIFVFPHSLFNFSLPIIYSSYLILHCSLLISLYTLLTFHSSLFFPYYSLLTVLHSLLLIPDCSVFTPPTLLTFNSSPFNYSFLILHCLPLTLHY